MKGRTEMIGYGNKMGWITFAVFQHRRSVRYLLIEILFLILALDIARQQVD